MSPVSSRTVLSGVVPPFTRSLALRLVLVVFCTIGLFALGSANASAAYSILDFKLTPSTTQAGGHPKTHYHVDPDATNADKTGGDDLKKVVIDYPAGLLGNPEAATTKCGATQFAGDVCPTASYIGSMTVKWRETSGTFKSAPGSVYVLTPATAGSAITVGFIVRPGTGWRKIYLKTEITGVVTVRSGVDADYGLTLVVDNIPRTLTSTAGSTKNITVSDIAVDINAKANTSQTGPYFTFNPTRCTAANSRATISSYNNVVVVKSSTFTPTGCSSVPFNPTASVTPANLTAGASTGVSATFTVPTANATIQNSHVQKIQTDLPTGTGLDFPAISAVPALCTDTELNADSCPAGAKIGNVSANVPFLPPAMTGDVYLMQRGNAIIFGYVLRGSNSVKAMLKGSAFVVDIDNDGAADLVRAVAAAMPQAPWSTATINFTAALIKNPVSCDPASVTTTLTGWSGATATRTNGWGTLNCPPPDAIPPEVHITAPANGSITNAASIPVSYTATDSSGVTPVCSPANGSPVSLAPGDNTIQVSCHDGAGNIGTDSVQVTRDTQPPVVTITSPASGAFTQSSSTVLNFSATDNSGLPTTCDAVNGSTVSLTAGSNTITVSCTDVVSNTGSASATVTRLPAGVGDGYEQVSTGYYSTCATTVDHTARCWGYRGHLLADGTGTDSNVPLDVLTSTGGPLLTGVKEIGVGNSNACALMLDGKVKCWGSNSWGQTGTGVAGGSVTNPTDVVSGSGSTAPLTGAVDLTVTGWGACALMSDTTTKCWGYNSTGFVGDGSTTNRPAPVSVVTSATDSSPLSSVISIAASAYHMCAALVSSQVVCWGSNSGGRVQGPGTSDLLAPVVITTNGLADGTPLTGVDAVYGGGWHSCVHATSGQLLCWGQNSGGATGRGIGTNTTFQDPQPVTTGAVPSPALTGVVATADDGGLCAVLTESTIRCWGANAGGAVGDGTFTDRSFATQVVSGDGSSSPLTGVVQSDTQQHTCAVMSDHTINCWGANATGGLGDGTTINRNYPSPAGATPPSSIQVTITSPANNSSTSAASVTLGLSVSSTSAYTCAPAAGAGVPLVAGANTIVASCTNAEGVTDTDTVTVYRDNIAPVISGLQCTSSGGSCLITYSVSDNLDPNPTCTPPSGSVFTGGTGTTAIVVTCTDDAGNTASATVYCNPTPLVVTITGGPANGGTTTDDTPTFTYQANQAVSGPYPCPAGQVCITVMVNLIGFRCSVDGGAPASCPATTAYGGEYTTPPLTNGQHTFCVTAYFIYGSGESTACRTFTVTTIPPPTVPVVTITSPTSGAVLTTSPVNVTYLVNGASTIPNGVVCTVNGSPSSNTSSNPVSLTFGINAITVTCSNSAGTGTASVSVELAGEELVEITAPADGTYTASATVTLHYTTSASGWACDKADGSSISLVGNWNTISVTCTTNSGNTVTDSVAVFRDNTSPVVDNLQCTPTAGGCLLSYTASDNSGIAPTCTPPSGSVIPLNIGANVISVTCVDIAGNTGSVAITIHIDPTVPVMVITSPANNTYTTASTINVAYTANGNQTIPPGTTCTVNGNPSTSPTTNSVPLSMGTNTITVACTNAGGTGSATVTVYRGTPPTIGGISCGPPITTNSYCTLSYTINGASSPPSGTTCTPAAGTTIALAYGSNTITVTCSNSFGTGVGSIVVTRYHTLTVAITSPVNGANIGAPSTNVSYTVNGSNSIPSDSTCTVNGSPSTSPTTNTVALSLGANTITVICSNPATSASNSINVTRWLPLGVQITSPANGTNTTATSVNVTYTVNGASSIPSDSTCTVNGSASTSTTTNSRSLSLGANTITVTCSNSSTSQSASVTVNRYNTLTVAITSPANGATISSSSTNVTYVVNGSITIPSDSTCTVNGSASASTTANTVALSPGTNMINVTCQNPATASTASVNVLRDSTAPVISNLQCTPVTGGCLLTYTVTDDLDPSPTCNPVSGTIISLVAGPNTIIVRCVDNAGNVGNAAITITGPQPPPETTITTYANPSVGTPPGYPVVAITSPVNDTTVTTSTTTVVFTIDGSSTIPSGTTCQRSSNSGGAVWVSVTATSISVSLTTGQNAITIKCTDSHGPGVANVTVYRTNPTPTVAAGPTSPASPTSPAAVVTFTGTGATGFECRVDSDNYTGCTSPWTIPTSGLAGPAEHSYDVRAVNGSTSDATPIRGFFWKDDRNFDATGTATAVANSLEPTAADANDAGAHPDVVVTLNGTGWDDIVSADVIGPDGMTGSLKAVPVAKRCTKAYLDTNGDCQAAAQVLGTATATVTSVTDGTITATGDIYLMDPAGLDATDAAGVVAIWRDIPGTVTPNLGNVVARGSMRVNDQGRNLRVVLNNMPQQTSTGNRFHLRSGSLTLRGDIRPTMSDPIDETNPPLLTNQHTCASLGMSRPRYSKFYGTGGGYGGSTITSVDPVEMDYPVDNCTALPFSPTANYTIANHKASPDTGNIEAGQVDIDMSLPYDNSTVKSVSTDLAPWLAVNLDAFGASSDMCSPVLAKNASPGTTAPAYYYFDYENANDPCPSVAKVGTAEITTPLFDGAIHGDIWLIDKMPVPWLGIRIDPSVNPANPRGVKIGMIVVTNTVALPPSCTVGVDVDCFTYLRATASALPDMPMTSVSMHIGSITGRAGTGSVMSDYPIKNAQSSDDACQESNPALNHVDTTLVPWSGGSSVPLSEVEQPTGCDP